MKIYRKTFSVLILFFFTSSAYANSYIEHTEIRQLPELQQQFILDVVRAYRENDNELINSLLHSSIKSNVECTSYMHDMFKNSTIHDSYAVKVKPGKKEGSLYFKIRYAPPDNPDSRSFKMMKNVVNENGRLVMNMNCEAVLKFIEKVKSQKDKE